MERENGGSWGRFKNSKGYLSNNPLTKPPPSILITLLVFTRHFDPFRSKTIIIILVLKLYPTLMLIFITNLFLFHKNKKIWEVVSIRLKANWKSRNFLPPQLLKLLHYLLIKSGCTRGVDKREEEKVTVVWVQTSNFNL